MFRVILIAATLLISPALCKADDVEKLIYATCRVSSDMTGTGVVIERDAKYVYVLTAHHVAHNNATVEFCTEKFSGKIPAEVFRTDKNVDLTVLRAKVEDFGGYPIPRPIQISNQQLAVGDKVYTAGCPSGNWTSAIIGTVLEPEEIRWGFMKMKPCIIPGRSGSAVCAHGKIVGVILRYDDTNSEHTLCATLKQIRDFLGK